MLRASLSETSGSVIASRVVVVSDVVAELAFRMKLLGIHDVDVSASYPNELTVITEVQLCNRKLVYHSQVILITHRNRERFS